MSYIETKGNIFNTKAMAVVNTVNCVGVMGKGIALDFKLRFPEMFKEYQRVCFQHLLKPGQILPYKKNSPVILNFCHKRRLEEAVKSRMDRSYAKEFCE